MKQIVVIDKKTGKKKYVNVPSMESGYFVSAMSNYSDVALGYGPVVYYDIMRSVTGSTLIDLSYNGNNGTAVNNPTYMPNYGGYLIFNGTNNYINTNLPALSPYTVTYVFNAISFVGNEDQLLSTTSSNYFGLSMLTGSGNNHYFNANFSGSAHTASAISLNTWYNVTVTSDGSSSTSIYVNGTLSQTYATGSAISSGSGALGYQFSGSNKYSNIDFVAFAAYNYVLSSAQISNIYSQYKWRYTG
jgi:hypothetical protein